jgi:hypothetical protein
MKEISKDIENADKSRVQELFSEDMRKSWGL